MMIDTIGIRKAVQGTYLAPDGTIFLSGGRHEVFELFKGRQVPSERSLVTFSENISSRAEYCSSRNIGFENFVFPDKAYIQRDLLPFEVVSLFKSTYAERAAENTHYLEEELVSCGRPFPKTDTHYSVRANAACAVRMVKDIVPGAICHFNQHVKDRLAVNEKFSGDLGLKFNPRITERSEKLRRGPEVSVESNGVTSGNDGLLMIASNPGAFSKKKLLLFGDSYFRALLPYLSFFFGTIVFCRTRFFHYEIVRSVAPDVIFTGMAERYLSRCFPDMARPHFLSYPYLKGKAVEPTAGFAAAFLEAFNPKVLARIRQ